MDDNQVFAETLAAWPDIAIVRLFEWIGNGQKLIAPCRPWSSGGVP